MTAPRKLKKGDRVIQCRPHAGYPHREVTVEAVCSCTRCLRCPDPFVYVAYADDVWSRQRSELRALPRKAKR